MPHFTKFVITPKMLKARQKKLELTAVLDYEQSSLIRFLEVYNCHNVKHKNALRYRVKTIKSIQRRIKYYTKQAATKRV